MSEKEKNPIYSPESSLGPDNYPRTNLDFNAAVDSYDSFWNKVEESGWNQKELDYKLSLLRECVQVNALRNLADVPSEELTPKTLERVLQSGVRARNTARLIAAGILTSHSTEFLEGSVLDEFLKLTAGSPEVDDSPLKTYESEAKTIVDNSRSRELPLWQILGKQFTAANYKDYANYVYELTGLVGLFPNIENLKDRAKLYRMFYLLESYDSQQPEELDFDQNQALHILASSLAIQLQLANISDTTPEEFWNAFNRVSDETWYELRSDKTKALVNKQNEERRSRIIDFYREHGIVKTSVNYLEAVHYSRMHRIKENELLSPERFANIEFTQEALQDSLAEVIGELTKDIGIKASIEINTSNLPAGGFVLKLQRGNLSHNILFDPEHRDCASVGIGGLALDCTPASSKAAGFSIIKLGLRKSKEGKYSIPINQIQVVAHEAFHGLAGTIRSLVGDTNSQAGQFAFYGRNSESSETEAFMGELVAPSLFEKLTTKTGEKIPSQAEIETYHDLLTRTVESTGMQYLFANELWARIMSTPAVDLGVDTSQGNWSENVNLTSFYTKATKIVEQLFDDGFITYDKAEDRSHLQLHGILSELSNWVNYRPGGIAFTAAYAGAYLRFLPIFKTWRSNGNKMKLKDLGKILFAASVSPNLEMHKAIETKLSELG